MSAFEAGWFDLSYSQHFRVSDGHRRHEGTDREYVVVGVTVHMRDHRWADRFLARPYSVSFYSEPDVGHAREVVDSGSLNRTTRAWVQPAVDVAQATLAAMVAARREAVR